jgi:hypothetical protein
MGSTLRMGRQLFLFNCPFQFTGVHERSYRVLTVEQKVKIQDTTDTITVGLLFTRATSQYSNCVKDDLQGMRISNPGLPLPRVLSDGIQTMRYFQKNVL